MPLVAHAACLLLALPLPTTDYGLPRRTAPTSNQPPRARPHTRSALKAGAGRSACVLVPHCVRAQAFPQLCVAYCGCCVRGLVRARRLVGFLLFLLPFSLSAFSFPFRLFRRPFDSFDSFGCFSLRFTASAHPVVPMSPEVVGLTPRGDVPGVVDALAVVEVGVIAEPALAPGPGSVADIALCMAPAPSTSSDCDRDGAGVNTGVLAGELRSSLACGFGRGDVAVGVSATAASEARAP